MNDFEEATRRRGPKKALAAAMTWNPLNWEDLAMKRWIALGVLTTVFTWIGLVAAELQQGQSAEERMEQENQRRAAEVAARGTKLCSVFQPGNWRDTINVPSGATPSGCRDFMNVTKATDFQLGCVRGDGRVALGPPGGGLPDPNCGW